METKGKRVIKEDFYSNNNCPAEEVTPASDKSDAAE